MWLHHVGIVVARLDEPTRFYTRLWDLAALPRVYEDPLQQALVTFVEPPGSGLLLEFVAPRSDSSAVAQFLSKHGGGLHHICYVVPGLEQAIADFRKLGAVLVAAPVPAVAFGGRRICFLYTHHRLLTELVESHEPQNPCSILA